MRSIEDIANEYVTQDNAMTAYPIAVALQVVEKRVAADGCDYDLVSVDFRGDFVEFSTKEEVWDQYADWEGLTVEEAKENFKDQLSEYDTMEDLINMLWDSPRIIPIKKEHVYADNIFFTMSGYEAHIKSNGHNLRGARPYIIHLFRNSEMTAIAELLMDSATVPKDKWNESALNYYNRWKEGKR